MNNSVYIPDSDSSSIQTHQPDVPILECDSEADESPFCSLCLRERPPGGGGGEFYECTSGSIASEFRPTIQSIVGLELNMEDGFVICTSCWKMIQLIIDFRMCCFKAQDWAGRFGSRGIKCNDEWFNEEVCQAIECLRSMIREYVAQIEGDEADLEDQDEPEVITVEEDQTLPYEQEDQNDANEAVVTQISVGDFKIEVFDDVDQNVAEPTGNLMEQARCEECNQCFESKQEYAVHIQLCKLQSTTNDGQSTAGKVQFCTLCNAMLANKRTLRSHMQSVHGPKKHQCEHCPSKFARAYDLKKHRWSMHRVDLTNNQNSPQLIQDQPPTRSDDPNTKEKKIFNCNICAATFPNDIELMSHYEMAHSRDLASPSPRSSPKPMHQCPTCDKEFKKFCTFKQHVTRWHAHLFPAYAAKADV
uniref:C2H2-type domain-containing protein n=1 Tax=Culex tarsalis TaxID=7177 RepID=A0A1Q3F0S3_CULTA